jgi:hypothetical protein
MSHRFEINPLEDSKESAPPEMSPPELPSIDGLNLPGVPQTPQEMGSGSAVSTPASVPEPEKFDGLTAEEYLCAICEGSNRFKTGQELLDHFGRSWGWFMRLRGKPQYRSAVQETVARIAEQIVSKAVDVKALFNNEISRSVKTMIEIRDNPFEPGKTRLAASVAIVDRAPDTPKAKEAGSTNIVLQLPIQHMKTIQQALIEDRREDIVELIKGEDYHDMEGEQRKKLNSPDSDMIQPIEVE